MKVAQLAFSLSNRAGGIFEIQVGLSLALKTMGVDVVALGLQDDLTQRDASRWGGIPTKCLPVYGPRFFGYAKGFDRALENSNPDICHLHTLWMYPGIAMKNWSRGHNRPYMVTPNGMLEPWALANSGWKKKLAGFFYENAMLRGAACLQANTLKEADDFRAYGLRQRIEVIPNGVDLPELLTTEDTESTEGRKRLLFLGRIHPKKGLVGALRAWAELRNSPSATRDSAEWQFVIAGWDQGGHEAELKALCADLGLRTAVATTKDTNQHEIGKIIDGKIIRTTEEESGLRSAGQADASESESLPSQLADSPVSESPTRSASGPASSPATSYSLPATAPKALALAPVDVLFYGPAFGKDKDALLRSADAFILPSFSEGLPMSVLEAWSYGLPVVMTPECNLPEGFASDAALEIRNSAGGFEVIRTLIGMTDQERAAMGMRGRRLVEEKFTWQKVASQLKEIYESLL
jgi:glycosyltransferase involved in cell wall biosynthesis